LASPFAFAQNPKKLLSQADRAYFNDDWDTARKLYEQITTLQPNNIKANYRLGFLLLEQRLPAAAIQYLEKANKLSLKYNPDYAKLLAQAYHQSSSFDAAIKQYQLILGKTSKKEEEEAADTNKRIQECLSGLNLMLEKPTADVRNLGTSINSPQADYAPILTDKDQSLIFTSRRVAAGNGKPSSEDIYEVRRIAAGLGHANLIK
jgi:tetratricopeptide (TPR) repeat protein